MTAPTVEFFSRLGDNREMASRPHAFSPRARWSRSIVADASTPAERFRLLHADITGHSLSRDVEVALVRRGGAPALAGCHLVDMLHAAVECSTDAQLSVNGRQLIPLVDVAELEPGEITWTFRPVHYSTDLSKRLWRVLECVRH